MGTRAYLTAEGRLAPTQETAGKGSIRVDIPYAKPEQLALINDLIRQGEERGARQVRDRLAPAAPPPPQRDMSAGSCLARMDASEGTDPDELYRIISQSGGYALGKYAEAVAVAFSRLGGAS